MAAEDVRQIRISFRAEAERDNAAFGRAGLTSLEQVETEMEDAGTPITVEPAALEGGDGERGFADSVLISVVADALTTLLFRASTDLMLRWRRARRHTPASAQTSGSGSGQGGSTIILRAGDSQLAIPFDTPDQQIYAQLALWSPRVLAAGGVTFEVSEAWPAV